MKRTRIAAICAAAAAIVLVCGGAAWLLLSLNSVTRQQAAAYQRYSALTENLAASRVELTEGGALVGSYTLAQLGVADETAGALVAQFSPMDRIDPAEFAALGSKARLSWEQEEHPDPTPLRVSYAGLETTVVDHDLAKTARTPSRDAYAHFLDGGFVVEAEVQGNTRRDGVVREALSATLAQMTIPEDGPATAQVELTDFDCYIPPAVTKAEGSFDCAALLQETTADMTITVNLPGQQQVLQVAPLLSLDENNRLVIDEVALAQQIAQWAAAFNKTDTPYLLATYSSGLKPLSFLHCAYTLDQAGLKEKLMTRLQNLIASPVSAPYSCTRNGEPFEISGTYVEVDLQGQQMTYYKDGEVLVHTDVVTGLKGVYDTPTGYYKVQTHSPNAWLTGPDYHVFVKYWVGFYLGYGLHDSSWRTIYGGNKYVTDGSHGCINTPEAAMEIIYNDITIGTPVVLY